LSAPNDRLEDKYSRVLDRADIFQPSARGNCIPERLNKYVMGIWFDTVHFDIPFLLFVWKISHEEKQSYGGILCRGRNLPVILVVGCWTRGSNIGFYQITNCLTLDAGQGLTSIMF